MSGPKVKVTINLPELLFSALKAEFRLGTGIVLRARIPNRRKSTNPKILFTKLRKGKLYIVHLRIMDRGFDRIIEISSPQMQWVLPILKAHIKPHIRIIKNT